MRDKSLKWAIFLMVSFIAAATVALEGWAAEGKYPSRTIQVIICFAPGSSDLAMRPFADKLPDYLKQPITIVYKPGAAGVIGASFAAKAKPDGYTLLFVSGSTIIINPITNSDVDYTLDDFIPICRLITTAAVLAVKADSPFKTLKDLVEAAKKNPGKLTYSTTGVYSTLHIPVEMFTQSAGIKMTHVPCPGSAPATAALLGGHVDATSSSMASITPHLKAGSLRALTVFQTERLKDFPDVPCISELGYTGRFFSFQGLAAPKGTPDEVIRTVSGAVKKITEDHKAYVEGRLEPISLKMAYLGPEEFLKSLKEDREAMTRIYEDMKKTNP